MSPDSLKLILNQASRILGDSLNVDSFLDLNFHELELNISVRASNVLRAQFESLTEFLSYPRNSFIQLRNVGVGTQIEIVQLQSLCKEAFQHLSGNNYETEVHSQNEYLPESDISSTGTPQLMTSFPKLVTLPKSTSTFQILDPNILPGRANSLIKTHFHELHQLLSTTIDELYQMKNVGAQTVDSIFDALKTAESKFDTIDLGDHEATDHPDSMKLVAVNPFELKHINSFRMLFRTDAFDEALSLQEKLLPKDVHLILKQIIRDLFPVLETKGIDPISNSWNLDKLIDLIIETACDDRDIKVINWRIFQSPPLILEDIGKRLDITRERVRQIETKALESIALVSKRSEFSIFHWVVHEASREYGDCFQIEELKSFINANPSILISDFNRLINWLRFLPPELYTIKEDIISLKKIDYSPFPDDLKTSIFKFGTPLAETEIVNLLRGYNWSNSVIESYINNLKRIFGDYYHPKKLPIEDIVHFMLTLYQEPMSVSEIHKRLGNPITPNGIRERLRLDNRIVKLQDRHYGLTKWGLEEIRTTSKEIDNYLVHHANGIAKVSELITSLINKGYKESTIRVYLNVPKYEMNGNDLRIRENLNTFEIKTKWKRSNYFYPVGESLYSLLLNVNPDIIRGIGPNIPATAFKFLNGQVGEETCYNSGSISVRVTWPPNLQQPTLSTLRSLCLELNAEDNNRILLVFDTIRRTINYKLISDTEKFTEQQILTEVKVKTGIDFSESPLSPTDYLCQLFDCPSPEILNSILIAREDRQLLKAVQHDANADPEDISSLL